MNATTVAFISYSGFWVYLLRTPNVHNKPNYLLASIIENRQMRASTSS